MKAHLVIVAIALLGGCNAPASVQVNTSADGTFSVFAALPNATRSDLQSAIGPEAFAFCERSGKRMLLLSEHEGGDPPGLEMRFACI